MLRVPQRQGRSVNVQCHGTDLSDGLLIRITALKSFNARQLKTAVPLQAFHKSLAYSEAKVQFHQFNVRQFEK